MEGAVEEQVAKRDADIDAVEGQEPLDGSVAPAKGQALSRHAKQLEVRARGGHGIVSTRTCEWADPSPPFPSLT
jgi:hypothetical protein